MMPRMKSVTSIEAKIALAHEKLLAAEARYNAWAEKLLALQKEKEEVQAANIARLSEPAGRPIRS